MSIRKYKSGYSKLKKKKKGIKKNKKFEASYGVIALGLKLSLDAPFLAYHVPSIDQNFVGHESVASRMMC